MDALENKPRKPDCARDVALNSVALFQPFKNSFAKIGDFFEAFGHLVGRSVLPRRLNES